MTDLSIIIVSWNVETLLDACLSSIFENLCGLDAEVIVVDSASSDRTVEMVRERYPAVRLMPQAENVGFTRGNNIGLAAAQGEYLLLLNPDTEVIGEMLGIMVRHLRENTDVGAVGPHTLNPDGSTQPSRRQFPTVATGFFESTPLRGLAPAGLIERYNMATTDDGGTFEVDWVQGHALMMRRAAYEAIGALDEGYVMYFEELDWCKRARLAGWKVVYVGDAQVVHYGGSSTTQAGAYTYIQFNRSKVRYFRKYHGSLIAGITRVFLLAGFLWEMAIEGTKFVLRHKPDLRRERLGVYWRVVRSGL